MASTQDPRQALARRLRTLREEHWPGVIITQSQLARALGGDQPLSVPLISSWESLRHPKLPPTLRLEAYARFFASARSLDGGTPHLLEPESMTNEERRAQEDLASELLRLRSEAAQEASTAPPAQAVPDREPGPWHFDDDRSVTLVSAQLPAELLSRIPYTDAASSDYASLYAYSDLDALIELFGHIRAANPASQVNLRLAQQLAPDDYTTHLVSLGGINWNTATDSALDNLQLPVRQVYDPGAPGNSYFEVIKGDQTVQYHPRLEKSKDRTVLREDIALFTRGINPYNRERTFTTYSSIFEAGAHGAVKALTDVRFRDRNAEYLNQRFDACESFCILSRVLVVNGMALTPDWTLPEYRLFEWGR